MSSVSILNSHPLSSQTRLAAAHLAVLTIQFLISVILDLEIRFDFGGSGCLVWALGLTSIRYSRIVSSFALTLTQKSTKYLCLRPSIGEM